jgi:hypothetical protein
VHVARLLPASIRRAFFLMWMRVRQVFGEAPILFFGVVLGVALTFRVAVGWARDASTPPVIAPTFVTTGPEPGIASGFVAPERPPSTSTAGMTAQGGAAAQVPTIGLPSPPRVAPKPRGHGRRPVH